MHSRDRMSPMDDAEKENEDSRKDAKDAGMDESGIDKKSLAILAAWREKKNEHKTFDCCVTARRSIG